MQSSFPIVLQSSSPIVLLTSYTYAAQHDTGYEYNNKLWASRKIEWHPHSGRRAPLEIQNINAAAPTQHNTTQHSSHSHSHSCSHSNSNSHTLLMSICRFLFEVLLIIEEQPTTRPFSSIRPYVYLYVYIYLFVSASVSVNVPVVASPSVAVLPCDV